MEGDYFQRKRCQPFCEKPFIIIVKDISVKVCVWSSTAAFVISLILAVELLRLEGKINSLDSVQLLLKKASRNNLCVYHVK